MVLFAQSPKPQDVIDTNTMNFPQAIQQIIKGKKITKIEWGSTEFYGILKDAHLVLHKPDGIFYQWVITEGDLIGTDWIVID